ITSESSYTSPIDTDNNRPFEPDSSKTNLTKPERSPLAGRTIIRKKLSLKTRTKSLLIDLSNIELPEDYGRSNKIKKLKLRLKELPIVAARKAIERLAPLNNTFILPKIVYSISLIFSLYILLFIILFYIYAFKAPYLISIEDFRRLLIEASLIISSLTNFDTEEVIYLIRVRNIIIAYATSRTFIKYYRPY
ncbi:hypothetical protein N7537_010127, partial [Penicillium hordei]